jgi:hypothetical protein
MHMLVYPERILVRDPLHEVEVVGAAQAVRNDDDLCIPRLHTRLDVLFQPGSEMGYKKRRRRRRKKVRKEKKK